ncbi:TadE family type IV pilus minor pilin [Aeromicrobium sp. REDSEA-S38_B2]|jgi:Flp pilus assembly protein TadG|uniref:TadE family type IV pilus minor pilin n=1 Tax=Aeromicrobium sp. REDSEA-S38_B2 TaxID=1811528 RepID=UPI000AEB6A0C|nr:TadE family type IV pilus minor pilin [Aeromicrobium sp. REDSEA-S38_B2]
MRRRGERGLATAELAVLAPFALVLVVLLLWVASLGLTQVRLVDAAREGARLVARGEPEADAVEAVRRLAPAGSTVDVAEGADGTVAVTVRVRARAPLGFASTVGSVGLDASAVAAVEAP